MELKDINKTINELREAAQDNAIKLARMEEKIAIRSVAFGAIGAAIPVIIMLLISFIK